ncbi:MAG TPA: histidine phosphatase family protein [Candidatus Limnocylindria bacterium]|nr:histidine phosphatase family protein [Candidatus Limnocylindria bacterium]
MSDGRLELPNGLAATIVLVRHGESTYVAEGRFQGRHDPGLSPLGERQAQLVAQRLASRHEGSPLPVPAGDAQGVWHSPLRRAADTARTIGAGLGQTVALHGDERLTELAQGEWEGLLHSEVNQRWPLELARWREDPLHFQAPGGEALGEAAGRVSDALEGILRALAGNEPRRPGSDTAGDMAAVRGQPVPGYPETSSGAGALEPWAIAVAHDGIFRLLLMRLLDVPLERFWSFPFSLCSITVVTLRDGLASLRAHNLADHLAPLAADEVAAQEARGDRRGAL